MKTFYTSNFKNIKNVTNPISIARKSPEWYKGQVLYSLCPTWDLVSAYKIGKISDTEYEKRYRKELEANGVNFQLLSVILPDNTTFLCWEPRGKFCHRHLIANYLKDYSIVSEI